MIKVSLLSFTITLVKKYVKINNILKTTESDLNLPTNK